MSSRLRQLCNEPGGAAGWPSLSHGPVLSHGPEGEVGELSSLRPLRAGAKGQAVPRQV